MTIEKFEEINEMISKCEKESAKSEGVIETIKKKWKEDYGFDDLESAERKLEELTENLETTKARKEKLEKKLEESYDWDSLKEELN